MYSKRFAVFIGIGFEIVLLVAGAAYLGRYLDERYQWQGMATAGLVVLALVGWFVHLIVLLKQVQENDPEPK